MDNQTPTLSSADVEDVSQQQPGGAPSLSSADVEDVGEQQPQPKAPTGPDAIDRFVQGQRQSDGTLDLSNVAGADEGMQTPMAAGTASPDQIRNNVLTPGGPAGKPIPGWDLSGKPGPVWHPVQGAKQVAAGTKNVAEGLAPGVAHAIEGLGGNVDKKTLEKPVNLDQAALGGTQMMAGTMEATKPLMLGGIAAAPFRAAIMYGAGVATGSGAKAVAAKMGATPNEQEFFHTAFFFLPDVMVKAAGIEASIQQQGSTDRARISALGGKVGVTAARNPEAVGIAGNIGDTRFGYVKPRSKGVNVSDQVPTGIPAPDPVTVQGNENVDAVTNLAARAQDTTRKAAAETGMAPPPPKPGEPGSTEMPHPAGMDDGILTQQTVDNASAAIQQLPDNLKPQGILSTVKNLAKWVRGKMTIITPDNKVHQVTGQTPAAQDASAQTIATKIYNDTVEQSNQKAEEAKKQQEENAKTQQEEEQAAVEQTTEGGKPAKTEATATPRTEIPDTAPVRRARALLQSQPKNATAEQLANAVRGKMVLTTSTLNNLVQEEIQRRANQKQDEGQAAETGQPIQPGMDRQSLQEHADKVARGEEPYVFVPKGTNFKPQGTDLLNTTKVTGAGDHLSGTYYHAKDIKSSEIRDAAKSGSLADLIDNWKQAHPAELGNDEVEHVAGGEESEQPAAEATKEEIPHSKITPHESNREGLAKESKEEPGGWRSYETPHGKVIYNPDTWEAHSFGSTDRQDLQEEASAAATKYAEEHPIEKNPETAPAKSEGNSSKSEAAPTEIRQGKVGDKLAAGEKVLTATGRETTPFPKIDTASDRKTQNTVKRVDQWLMDNAIAEAKARGDEFNQRQFEQNRDKPSPADKDSAEMYLFDKDSVQPIPKPITKPLIPEKPAVHPDVQQILDAYHSGGKSAAQTKLDEIAKAKKLKDYEALMLAEAVKRELAKEKPESKPAADTAAQTYKPGEKIVVKGPRGELRESTIRFDNGKGKYVLKGEKQAVKPSDIVARGTMEDYRAQHFAPGNVIKSSYWQDHDKVLSYQPTTDKKAWQVNVIKSDAEGNPVEGERARIHSTEPNANDVVVKRGTPVETPTEQPEPEEEAVPEPVEAKDHGVNSLVNAIYQKLEAGESLGNVTELTKLAEKHMGSSRVSGEWSPKDMFDAMEAAVNRYLIAHGKRWMEMDGEEALAELRDLMKRLTTQGTRTEEQIKKQQFSTPPTESYVAARAAALKPTDIVLEPSAGNGGLAAWPKAIGAEVHVNEIAERRQDMLRAAGFGEPTAHNGEAIHALLDTKIKPTVILMNPPFSAGASGGRNRNVYGFNHVEQALQRLQKNGRLVAILGGGQANEPEGGASLRAGASGKWFEKLAKMYNIRANIRVSGKEYAKYGTSFATRIIVIDKDGPTPDLSKVVQKNVDTLEEAYGSLEAVTNSRPAGSGESLAPTGGAKSPARPEPQNGLAPGARSGGSGGGGRVSASGSSSTGIRPQDGSIQSAGNDRADDTGGRIEPAADGAAAHQPEQNSGNEPADSSQGGDGDVHPVRRTGEAGRRLEPEADIERVEHSDEREEEDSSAYVKYRPSVKGAEHPGAIVESKTMATVPLPPFTYKPALPKDTIEGKLSAVQLEPVILTGQSNEQRLPGTGARATTLIGDGTGVGKGREAAGIIFDSWNQGRRRLVWVSQTWDLMQAAIRDLKAVGAEELAGKMLGLNKTDAAEELKHEGVIYTTYGTLRAADKKGNTRFAQIQKWLRGEDEAEGGHILFDEAHNLKNAVAGFGEKPSQIGAGVKKLLEDNPNLRVSPLSATAASEVMNLGYLDRLGLWGPGTAFPGGFNNFVNEIGSGGLSAMELVARELKAMGRYVSRTLSFKGVTYDQIEAPLSEDQKELYRTATRAWASVYDSVDNTINNVTGGGKVQRSRFSAMFNATQLRFFNVLLTTLKIPAIVPKIEQDLKDGKSVVITLVNTNEAAQNREKNRVAADSTDDEDEIPEYDFGPAEMLISLVHDYYPTQQYIDAVDSSGNPIKKPLFDADGKPVHNPDAVAARDQLEADLKRDLKMPANPLDILIQSLGGPHKVAEMTGRKEYFDDASGKFVPRGDKGTPRDKVNLAEMDKFQSGKKRVAVLSNAAGTGIDLHSSLRAKNQQKRSHYTLQAGWSADKQMQMFGRTNRTEQAHPPEYHLVVSDMGGEKRFIATIAKRLGSLNAISKGQKDAGGGTDMLSKVNFESDQGRAACEAFYRSLLSGTAVPGTELNGMDVLRAMHVLKQDPQRGVTVPDQDRTNVTRMLNRILALDPDVQNAVYDYYYDIFEAVVQRALADGSLDTGVKELPGEEHRIAESTELSTDPSTGAKTTYSKVDTQFKNRRLSAEGMEKRLKGEKDAKLLVRTDSKTGEQHIILAEPAPAIVHADGRTEEALYISRPGDSYRQKAPKWKIEHEWEEPEEAFGKEIEKQREAVQSAERSVKTWQDAVDRGGSYASEPFYKTKLTEAQARFEKEKEALAELEKNAKDPQDEARELWTQEHDATPTHRTVTQHFISGSVLRYWAPIRETSRGRMNIYTLLDNDSGKRLVGVQIPDGEISKLISRISGGQSNMTADSLREDVLRNGTEYRLEGNIRVTRGTIARHLVVRLHPPSNELQEGLKQLGVLYERGVQPIYYVPSGAPGYSVLERVLKAYPVQQETPGSKGLMSEEGSATVPKPVEKAGEYLGKAAATTLKDTLESIGAAGKSMKQLGREFVALTYPRALASERALDIMGKAIGTPALSEFMASQLMNGINKMFSQMPEDAWTDFIDRYENGQKQPSEELTQAAELIRTIIEGQEAEEDLAANLGRSPSQRVTLPRLENYFPHRYSKLPGGKADVSDHERLLKMAASRRPLEGSKKFLKQRQMSYREAMKQGAKPLGNPVQILLKRIQEGSKFVAFKYMMHSGKQAGMIRFFKRPSDVPENFVEVPDKSMQVWRPVATADGKTVMTQTGKWYWEENFGRLVNNYISKDHIRDSSIGTAWAKLKNATTEARLSWSGFHFAYITVENFASGVNIGLDKLYNGGLRNLDGEKAIEGLADLGHAIVAPFTAIRDGGRMIQYARTPEEFLESKEGKAFAETYPDFPRLMELGFHAGLRWGMNPIYRQSLGDGFVNQIRDGHLGKATLKFFPWLSHLMMKPLFEHYIPRSKWVFFCQMLSAKLNQYSAALASGEVTEEQLARRVADAVENRFGELNYDNLYWNNTFRTMNQLMFRSASWKLGAWRGVTGAIQEGVDAGRGTFSASGFNDHIYDTIEDEPGWKNQARKFTARLPELGINQGWLASMALVTAVMSSVMVALATGKAIWNWAEEDHKKNRLSYLGALAFEAMHPRTGKLDPHGEPVRMSFPTGLKDYEHAYHNPVGYVRGSGADWMVNGLDTLQNKDAFGNYVFNPNDPGWQQFLQALKYNAKGDFLPMSLSNYRDQFGPKDTTSKLERATGLVGGSPKDYDRSAALNLALKLRPPHTPETPEQETAYQLLHDTPTRHLTRQAIREKKMDYLEHIFMQLHYDDAKKVMEEATPEERRELQPLMAKKQRRMMEQMRRR